MTARAWVLFIASSLIWGVPYLFIKLAIDAGVPPAFVAWSRTALGAAVLLPLALQRGALHGLLDRRRAVAIVAYALCEAAIPFVLISIGEQYVTSSLAAILIATMPLMVALLSIRFMPDDRLSAKRVVGLLIGLAGVIALLGLDIAGTPTEFLGAALVLLATLCYAIAPFIVAHRLADLDPLGPVAASLVVATTLLSPIAFLAPPHAVVSTTAWWSIAVLGVVCTALGLVVFFRLIAEAGPARAAVITYLNPLVAVIVGMVVLHEQLGLTAAAGLALILGGSWLSTGKSPH